MSTAPPSPARRLVLVAGLAVVALLATLGARVAGATGEAARSASATGESAVASSTGELNTTPTGLARQPIGTFASPVEVFTRSGDARIYVVERGGRIIAVDGPTTTVIVDVSAQTADGGERGLLGAAFHPTLDLLYVHYTDNDGDTRLVEYAADPSTAVADPTSARTVLTEPQPYANHNGGEVDFGPDGLLYLALGDGGSGFDPDRVALDLTSRLGKILRIDPLESGADPFTVPPDNPFVATPDAEATIWAYGLRNPWKFSFDPANGDLWIADVGQDRFEEVNRVQPADGRPAGYAVSFGWSAYEGPERRNLDQPADGHTAPFASYDRSGGRCSVSGGAVYRGSLQLALTGWYVFGDFCTGELLAVDSLNPGGPILTLGQMPQLAAVAAGPDGELYAVSLGGEVARLVPAGDVDCNGELDIRDALFVSQYAEGLRADTGTCPLTNQSAQLNATWGDVDGDGDVDQADAQRITECSVGTAECHQS